MTGLVAKGALDSSRDGVIDGVVDGLVDGLIEGLVDGVFEGRLLGAMDGADDGSRSRQRPSSVIAPSPWRCTQICSAPNKSTGTVNTPLFPAPTIGVVVETPPVDIAVKKSPRLGGMSIIPMCRMPVGR